jgi:hypothetical protein
MRLNLCRYAGGLIAVVVAAVGCTEQMPGTGTPIVLSYAPSQTVNLVVGQELDITVGTLGPGSYDAPTISPSILQLLAGNGAIVTPVTPGGPTQVFRFRAQAAGQAIITLGQSGRTTFRSDTVRDTVVVH